MSKNSMFWSHKNMLSKDCNYNMVIRERDSGKVYSLKIYTEAISENALKIPKQYTEHKRN